MRLTTTKFLGLALVLLATSAEAALINLTPSGTATNSNTGVVLSDLLSGQVMGIKVGDKDFTGFSYSTLPGDDMPAPANVNVLGFRDTDGNWGISFHGAFLDLPGGGPSDALLRFTVSVDAVGLRQGYLINDAHLFIGGTGVGANSVFTVDETFAGQPGISLNTHYSTLVSPADIDLEDWTDLQTPVASIVVTKDIFAFAGAGASTPARTTVIDQSFSQTIVPEPATVAIAMLGLMGFAAVRRK